MVKTGPRLESAKRLQPCPDPIGEERRSSRTGRGRRYQEFIEDISSTKKKRRRSHRSGEELSEPEAEMEALISTEVINVPTTVATTTTTPHVHWKKMRTAGLGQDNSTPMASTSSTASALPSRANKETSTASCNFDLDTKMEKIEPLKLPENISRGKSCSKSSISNRSTRQSHYDRATVSAQPSKAFESRLNKKTRQ